jgi:hypothetical protein
MIRSARPVLLAAVLALGAGTARADLDDIRAAAEAGSVEAQLELGILFEYGFNMKGNEIPALTWYMLAANQGNAKAVKLRDALMAKMSPPEIEEAVQQVTQFKPSGAPVVPPPAAAAPAPAPATAAEVESLPPLDQAPAEPAAAPGAPATAEPAAGTPPAQ